MEAKQDLLCDYLILEPTITPIEIHLDGGNERKDKSLRLEQADTTASSAAPLGPSLNAC